MGVIAAIAAMMAKIGVLPLSPLENMHAIYLAADARVKIFLRFYCLGVKDFSSRLL